jgi:hypothetical protein
MDNTDNNNTIEDIKIAKFEFETQISKSVQFFHRKYGIEIQQIRISLEDPFGQIDGKVDCFIDLKNPF